MQAGGTVGSEDVHARPATMTTQITLADGSVMNFERKFDVTSLRQKLALFLEVGAEGGRATAVPYSNTGGAKAKRDSSMGKKTAESRGDYEDAVLASLQQALEDKQREIQELQELLIANMNKPGGSSAVMSRLQQQQQQQQLHAVPSSTSRFTPPGLPPPSTTAEERSFPSAKDFAEAPANFQASQANAGARGGEAFARRDRQLHVGPPQVPTYEEIPLSAYRGQWGDAAADALLQEAQFRLGVSAAGNSRVNNRTQGDVPERMYADTEADFEQSVYIDRNRAGAVRVDGGDGGVDSRDIANVVEKEELLQGGKDMEVAFEVASVQSKIHNVC